MRSDKERGRLIASVWPLFYFYAALLVLWGAVKLLERIH